ncbi:hypothetical protein [Streptomyces sp. NPDC054961]
MALRAGNCGAGIPGPPESENTTLKQRVRQLTTDNRTLDERLKAARSNLRFQDRRVADLEAQITEPGPSVTPSR